MSLPPEGASSLEGAIWSRLEAIIDPCSRASGAAAGLVSMGLVGGVTINEEPDGAKVRVTLYITEPGCLMGALFALTAERELRALPRTDQRVPAHIEATPKLSVERSFHAPC